MVSAPLLFRLGVHSFFDVTYLKSLNGSGFVPVVSVALVVLVVQNAQSLALTLFLRTNAQRHAEGIWRGSLDQLWTARGVTGTLTEH